MSLEELEADYEAITGEKVEASAADDEEAAALDGEPVDEPDDAEVEETQEEPEAGEEAAEEIPDEPEDHRERSRLGRRVSEIERRIDERLAALEELIRESRPLDSLRAAEPIDEAEEEVEFPYAEKEIFDRYLERKFRELQRAEQERAEAEHRQYQRTYTRAAEVMLSQYEPDVAAKIEEALRSEKFDRRWSDDPFADLERNFKAAREYVMGSKKKKAPKRRAGALGVGGGSAPPARKVSLDLSGLDPMVREMVKDLRAVGTPEEEIAELLKG